MAKRDWSEIEEIARARKSPIGWEVRPHPPSVVCLSVYSSTADLTAFPPKPFYNQILQAGNPRLAATFVPKCTGLEAGQAISMYEKCGMLVKAAEEAVKARDAQAWTRLLETAGRGTQEGREIERLGKTVFKE